jgi:hypothetical protein
VWYLRRRPSFWIIDRRLDFTPDDAETIWIESLLRSSRCDRPLPADAISTILLRNAPVLDGTGQFRGDVPVNGQRNATGRISRERDATSARSRVKVENSSFFIA